MKCSIDLYINSNKVDIINSEQFAQQFAITQSFSDLYEPDKIVDSYSKSLTLPGTARNNVIFGHIWKLDSNNITAFNPSQLSDFQIFLNNELWQTGTVQLQEISIQNNVISYKIVLYGSITKVMSMLLNSDIDDENNKLLRSLKYPGNKLRHKLTGYMLYNMWNNNIYKPDGSINLVDYMQYVPCQNGLYDNFDSSKKLAYYYPWTTKNNHGTPYITCQPVIYADRQRPDSATVIQASSGDAEFDEYTLKQYRVEYQRPGIKMNKLVEQIVNDASTDVHINLSADFFNANNPYYNNTYLTLSQYTTDSESEEITGTIDNYFTLYHDSPGQLTFDLGFIQENGMYIIFSPDGSTAVYYGNMPGGTKHISLEFAVKITALFPSKIPTWDSDATHESCALCGYYDPDHLGNTFIFGGAGPYYTPFSWSVSAEAYANGATITSTPYTNGSYDASIHSRIYPITYDSSGYMDDWNICFYDGINNNYPNNKYQYTMSHVDLMSEWPSYNPINDSRRVWKPFKLDLDVSSLGNTGKIRLKFYIETQFVSVNWEDYEPSGHGHRYWRAHAQANNNVPVLFSFKTIPQSSGMNANNYYPAAYGYSGNGVTASYSKATRSADDSSNNGHRGDGYYAGLQPSLINTEDMFDTTTTQGEILLNYTKLLGLVYDVARDGSITIRSRNDYFSDYDIIDWSDKVDYSREFKVKPIPFNTRYLEMKYKSGGTYYENKYSNEFGLEYGEKKINTGFAFNSETTQLLDSIFSNTVIAEDPRAEYGTRFDYLGSSAEPDNYRGWVVKLWDNNPFAMPAYFTKDGEKKSPVDVKYSLLFNNGRQNNPSYITTDSSWMMSSDATVEGGKYCWVATDASSLRSNSLYYLVDIVSQMPQFTTHYDEYSWDIGYPRISYSGDNEYTYPSGSTVYSRFWDTYITEIYNVRNKILTCYVKLSWIDVLNFSFKNFVTINGVLYHPNKLLNVNPLSDDPIQVELIQVQNIDAYTSGQNIPGGTAVEEYTVRRLRRKGLLQTEEDEE